MSATTLFDKIWSAHEVAPGLIFIDGRRHELGEGDSVTFDADLPHHFENNGETDARLIAVVAAGLRRG